MSGRTREDQRKDIEQAYRAGFNTAVLLAEHACRDRAIKHLDRRRITKLRREWALEANICADTILVMKKE